MEVSTTLTTLRSRCVDNIGLEAGIGVCLPRDQWQGRICVPQGGPSENVEQESSGASGSTRALEAERTSEPCRVQFSLAAGDSRIPKCNQPATRKNDHQLKVCPQSLKIPSVSLCVIHPWSQNSLPHHPTIVGLQDLTKSTALPKDPERGRLRPTSIQVADAGSDVCPWPPVPAMQCTTICDQECEIRCPLSHSNGAAKKKLNGRVLVPLAIVCAVSPPPGIGGWRSRAHH